jgi:hypothetical protein
VTAATTAASASSGASTTGMYIERLLNAARQWKRNTCTPRIRNARATNTT